MGGEPVWLLLRPPVALHPQGPAACLAGGDGAHSHLAGGAGGHSQTFCCFAARPRPGSQPRQAFLPPFGFSYASV